MKGTKKNFMLVPLAEFFFCFLNKVTHILILHWTLAYWFENKIIDMELGCMEIKTLKECNHISAVLSWA